MPFEKLKDKLVLLVEDSPTQALLLQDILEKAGLKVQLAVDGMEAIDQMYKVLPEVVISDIIMPRMDGYELCKTIKSTSEFKGIPIILWTRLTDTQDVIKGIQNGADSFITKCTDNNFILTAIDDVIENSKVPKEFAPGKEIAYFIQGKRYLLSIDPLQITELLLSTYLNAIQKNQELETANHKLIERADELKITTQELRSLNEMKNKFLGMAVHDLRNPLTVIRAYSDLLVSNLNSSLDAQSQKMLGGHPEHDQHHGAIDRRLVECVEY